MRVCRCRRCCSLSGCVCVYDLLIFYPYTPPVSADLEGLGRQAVGRPTNAPLRCPHKGGAGARPQATRRSSPRMLQDSRLRYRRRLPRLVPALRGPTTARLLPTRRSSRRSRSSSSRSSSSNNSSSSRSSFFRLQREGYRQWRRRLIIYGSVSRHVPRVPRHVSRLVQRHV